MNKFKKACEELAGYLNKDAKGIELLSRVTRIGNEMRTELASATEAKVLSESICQKHMETAVKASSEASKANAERQQHLDTIASLRCKVANYEKQSAEKQVQEPEAGAFEVTPKEVSRLVRDALSDKQHLNHKVKIIKKEDDVFKTVQSFCDSIGGVSREDAIVLHESVANLSYPELAKLGRLVAIYAIMRGHAVVTTTRFSLLYDPNNPETEAVEATNRLFVKFMSPRLDFSEDYRKYAECVGSRSQPIVSRKGSVK